MPEYYFAFLYGNNCMQNVRFWIPFTYFIHLLITWKICSFCELIETHNKIKQIFYLTYENLNGTRQALKQIIHENINYYRLVNWFCKKKKNETKIIFVLFKLVMLWKRESKNAKLILKSPSCYYQVFRFYRNLLVCLRKCIYLSKDKTISV